MATRAQEWLQPQAIPKLKRAAWFAMAAMTMFFVALTVAYLERNGLNTGWMSATLAEILSADTFLLLASSLALVRGHQFLRARHLRGTLRWTVVALGFGLAFLAGQALAWRQLLGAGVYVTTHPNSAFFYLITAAHAAHLAAALALLSWVLTRLWRGRLQPDRPLLMDVTAMVWHFLDFTWIYLYLVLLFYR
jgi:cytochrome c oxidase subunit 3